MAEFPRFLVDAPLNEPGEVVFNREESHHAATVLRLRMGDEVIIFDGAGNYGIGVIVNPDRKGVRVRIDAVQAEKRRPIHITIATGIPKGKRWQLLVEKCTELGVDRLVPMLSGRSVVKGDGDPGRWRRWAIEAAKQSRRAVIPEILEPVVLENTLALAARDKALPLLADPDGEVPRTYQAAIKEAGKVMVLVGPEGGFSDRELELFGREGVAKIRLSPFILRIETAAATACALIRDM